MGAGQLPLGQGVQPPSGRRHLSSSNWNRQQVQSLAFEVNYEIQDPVLSCHNLMEIPRGKTLAIAFGLLDRLF